VRLATLWLLFPSTIHGQVQVMQTPNENDIPKPVPADMSLAGSALPDIARFLNVRTAGAPSLSPDGTRLAFRTQISGTPQLWVGDAAGGWPRQLTLGESVTFQATRSTSDPEHPITSYKWDFDRSGGQAVDAEGAEASTTFPDAGAWRVRAPAAVSG